MMEPPKDRAPRFNIRPAAASILSFSLGLSACVGSHEPPAIDIPRTTGPSDPAPSADDETLKPATNHIGDGPDASLELLDPALEQLPPPIVTVVWVGDLELSGASTQISYDQADLAVEVKNLTNVELYTTVWLFGDDGTARGTKSIQLSELQLAPAESETVEVRVGSLGFELGDQRRSGQLDVAVQVQRDTDPSPSQAMTNSLFYHPITLEPPQILVYGKSTLDEAFSKGDYAGVGSIPEEEGVIYDRVLYGGRSSFSSPTPVEPSEQPREGADA